MSLIYVKGNLYDKELEPDDLAEFLASKIYDGELEEMLAEQLKQCFKEMLENREFKPIYFF